VCAFASRELGRQQPPTAGDSREFSDLGSGKKGKNPLNHMNTAKKQSKMKANGGKKLGLKVTGKVESQEEM